MATACADKSPNFMSINSVFKCPYLEGRKQGYFLSIVKFRWQLDSSVVVLAGD